MPRVGVREVLVEAAVTEFHRHGYAACSVDTITKAAGVPKGSFYNHFASKEHLGAEVVARYAAGSAWWQEVDPGLSPLQQLRARFRAVVDVLAESRFTRGCLLGNMGTEVADRSDVIREQVGTSLCQWSEDIVAILRAARAAGEISAGPDVERLGPFLLDAFQGAIMHSKVVKDVEPLEDFLSVVFDTVLR
ncbi:TetR/AcrR family transcriptional regulator [Pseudonocardia yunnanensis]|uniref:TetR family transcriptional regulator C-terminal domain-containing protein n=1 Tax=Pseudonocardia yunnanensis TaxID=58107 RepID=A0ABW4F2Z0_9PSEU